MTNKIFYGCEKKQALNGQSFPIDICIGNDCPFPFTAVKYFICQQQYNFFVSSKTKNFTLEKIDINPVKNRHYFRH